MLMLNTLLKKILGAPIIKKNVIKLTLISCVIITGVLLMNQHIILIYLSVLLLDP
jgi:hypothetical protein